MISCSARHQRAELSVGPGGGAESPSLTHARTHTRTHTYRHTHTHLPTRPRNLSHTLGPQVYLRLAECNLSPGMNHPHIVRVCLYSSPIKLRNKSHKTRRRKAPVSLTRHDSPCHRRWKGRVAPPTRRWNLLLRPPTRVRLASGWAWFVIQLTNGGRGFGLHVPMEADNLMTVNIVTTDWNKITTKGP